MSTSKLHLLPLENSQYPSFLKNGSNNPALRLWLYLQLTAALLVMDELLVEQQRMEHIFTKDQINEYESALKIVEKHTFMITIKVLF